MKLRRLSAAALVAVIGAGVVFPAAASASTIGAPYDGLANVTVEGGPMDPTDPLPDPEIPGDDIDTPNPEIPENPNPGTLGIQKVSILRFGTIQTGGNDITKTAAAVPVEKTTTDDQGVETTVDATRGHMVQFGDTRGTRAGYTVTAMLSQFENADGSEVLDGSTITYTNGILATKGTSTAPVYYASTFTLEDGVSKTIVGAQAQEGSGSWVLEYGQSTDYDTTVAGTPTGGTAGTDANSVTLFVPSGTAASMLATDYTASITWNVEATPYVPAP
ncbi:WxL domain-containing protein [Enterococcus sp. LJL120]